MTRPGDCVQSKQKTFADEKIEGKRVNGRPMGKEVVGSIDMGGRVDGQGKVGVRTPVGFMKMNRGDLDFAKHGMADS